LNSFYKSNLSLLLSLLFLVQLSACATLNESECKSANWEIIGLEDGSNGRPTSYIGEHRQACSEYTISPDLEAYLKGHQAGLKQFCTEQNGYRQGLSGHTLSQVCSGASARVFQRGHQRGATIHRAQVEIKHLKNQMDSHYHRLDDIQKNKKIKEDELVRDGTREYRRRELLEEIKELERESESIYIELDQMKFDLAKLELNYQRLIGN